MAIAVHNIPEGLANSLSARFAAGAIAWLVAVELVPAARKATTGRTVATALLVSFAAMLIVQVLLSRA